MLIRLSDQSLVDDLCESFRRAGFSAEPAGASMAEVFRPDAPERGQERREIEIHLRVWQAMQPDVTIEIVD
jgi:hypothetical protein